MISASRSPLSYKDRRSHQRQRFRAFGVVLLVLGIYILVSSFLLSPWVLKNQSMEPGFSPGTRILVVPYIQRDSEGHLKNPPQRGDIVAIHPPYIPETPWRLTLVNPIVRLVTLQKISLGKHIRHKWENERIFKRIIAVPGDTIRMEGSVAYVKRSEDDYFISEFEQSGIGYDLESRELPEGWDMNLPLSDTIAPSVLGENQYFVLGDNRADSNDSRYWGPISDTAIRGRGIFAYWPIKAFGRLP